MGGDHGLRIGIRAEQQADYTTIREINNAAFGREGESRLVDKLRMTSRFNSHLSLLAEVDGRVVGHVLFYPVDMPTTTLGSVFGLQEHGEFGQTSKFPMRRLWLLSWLKGPSKIVRVCSDIPGSLKTFRR
jgi:hypothetical protein